MIPTQQRPRDYHRRLHTMTRPTRPVAWTISVTIRTLPRRCRVPKTVSHRKVPAIRPAATTNMTVWTSSGSREREEEAAAGGGRRREGACDTHARAHTQIYKFSIWRSRRRSCGRPLRKPTRRRRPCVCVRTRVYPTHQHPFYNPKSPTPLRDRAHAHTFSNSAMTSPTVALDDVRACGEIIFCLYQLIAEKFLSLSVLSTSGCSRALYALTQWLKCVSDSFFLPLSLHCLSYFSFNDRIFVFERNKQKWLLKRTCKKRHLLVHRQPHKSTHFLSFSFLYFLHVLQVRCA